MAEPKIERRYSELIKLKTFEERFEYLKLDGAVGIETFGFDRYLNQAFYSSPEWKHIRDSVILRDNGCDLGCEDHPLRERIFIHHLNPIGIDDILKHSDRSVLPEFLICTSFETHNALHYGSRFLEPKNKIIERKPNDTSPWR